ncbi:hypothetical protein [Streptomyces sp. NPDC004266]|uniref:hypothetical protein n=1 Tax=Streptomyces sp. NPDC004266 TaxID=3364693 RepID=UPI0036807BA6
MSLDARRGVDADAPLRVGSADPPTVRSAGAEGGLSAVGDYGRAHDTIVEEGRLSRSPRPGAGRAATPFSVYERW